MPVKGVIELTWSDLAAAAGLVLVAGLVSVGLRLRLERRLAVAALRTLVQLLLVGYVLKYVFDVQRYGVLPLVAAVCVMFVVAAREGAKRPKRRFRGVAWLAFITLVASGLVTTATITGLVINVRPWYEPQYLVPLLGMVLGNQLTALSLCMDQVLGILSERRAEVEMELAHGATRWEAARDALSEGVRSGMIPVINAMTVVGIVALPGMMTGQILAGASPTTAVKYQIVVMFMIAGATAMSCIIMTLLTYRRLFNARHQLEADKIVAQRS
jgi:putative ABC transport system permease protein